MKDVREFDRDIAAAGNHDGFGQLIEMEGLIGSDAQLVPRQRGVRIGLAAHGDQDSFGVDNLTGRFDEDRMGAGEFGAGSDDLGAGVLQPVTVKPLQAVDFTILVCDQRRPVERSLSDGPAKAARIFEMLGELRGVDKQLFGNAAADHAGAAEPVLLRNGDFLAQAGRQARRAHPARAAADHKQVVVILAHCRRSFSRKSGGDRVPTPLFLRGLTPHRTRTCHRIR
jgi:hypothetical protein